MSETSDFRTQIDITRFTELSDGDSASLVELIQLYLTKTTEQILDLEKAFQRKSSQDIARIAHSLVGANAMVGLTSLVTPLRELEAAGEKEDLAFAHQVFEAFCAQFKTVHVALKKTVSDLHAA